MYLLSVAGLFQTDFSSQSRSKQTISLVSSEVLDRYDAFCFIAQSIKAFWKISMSNLFCGRGSDRLLILSPVKSTIEA
jgi:hypothetical protein